MDKYFEHFLKKFGPAIDPREVWIQWIGRRAVLDRESARPRTRAERLWLGGSSFLDKDALHIIARDTERCLRTRGLRFAPCG